MNPPTPTTVTWFQIVFALVAGGALAAVINGFFNRKQLGASAAKLITDAAASVTGSMQKRMRDLEQAEEERENAERQRDKDWRQFKVQLFKHEAWDRKMTNILRELDPSIELEDPPPLYPQGDSYF